MWVCKSLAEKQNKILCHQNFAIRRTKKSKNRKIWLLQKRGGPRYVILYNSQVLTRLRKIHHWSVETAAPLEITCKFLYSMRQSNSICFLVYLLVCLFVFLLSIINHHLYRSGTFFRNSSSSGVFSLPSDLFLCGYLPNLSMTSCNNKHLPYY